MYIAALVIFIFVCIYCFREYKEYGAAAANIIKNHYLVFSKNDGSSPIKAAIFTSVPPAILSTMLCKTKLMDAISAAQLLTIFSIFTTMLFTLLVLLIDTKQKNDYKIENNSAKIDARISRVQELIKETYYTIMFEILVDVCVLICGFIILFIGDGVNYNDIWTYVYTIINFVEFFFVFTFIFTLFIVLKRVYEIIRYDLSH